MKTKIMELISAHVTLFAEAEYMKDQGTSHEMVNEFPDLQRRCNATHAALEAEIDRVSKDAERYDYLLTKRLGWLSRLAPIPWKKQTTKEAMSAALDTAMKEPS